MRLRAAAVLGAGLALAACVPVEPMPYQPHPIDRRPVVDRPEPIVDPRPSRRPGEDRRPRRGPGPDGLPYEHVRPGESDRCGAGGQQHLVGRAWPQTLPPRMGPVRVIPFGGVMTMDLNPSRVNIELARDGRTIRRIWCG